MAYFFLERSERKKYQFIRRQRRRLNWNLWSECSKESQIGQNSKLKVMWEIILNAAGAAKPCAAAGGSRGAAPPLRIPYNLKIPQKNQFLQFNSIFLESMIYRKYSKKWIWWRSKLLAQYLRIIQKIQFLQIKSNLNEKKMQDKF